MNLRTFFVHGNAWMTDKLDSWIAECWMDYLENFWFRMKTRRASRSVITLAMKQAMQPNCRQPGIMQIEAKKIKQKTIEIQFVILHFQGSDHSPIRLFLKWSVLWPNAFYPTKKKLLLLSDEGPAKIEIMDVWNSKGDSQ